MTEDYYKQYEPFFGCWHMDRLLGEGPLSKVFAVKVESGGLQSQAALKAVTISQSPEQKQRMVQQIAMVNSLKSCDNIVSYENYQIVPHPDGTGWDILLLMELLTPLDQYLRQQSLSRQEILQLGIDLCKALEQCRQHRIVHLDIKPANIFRAADGTWKLGDFDIARVLNNGTAPSFPGGTPAYMAPEVYAGKDCGCQADLYSLGLVLYQLLNSNRSPFLPPAPAPFTFADREQAQRQRLSGAPLPMPCQADQPLWAIVKKACAYEPQDRYADATQMRQALEAQLSCAEEPPAVEPDSHDDTPHAACTWPASWRAEDIVRFTVSFGDLPIRCYTCDGNLLTAVYRIDVSRDGGQTCPPGYFDPVSIRLSKGQQEQLRHCLEAIPQERWASDPLALQYDRQCPTGYTRRTYFSCTMKNGETFDYLPGRTPAPGFSRLCRHLTAILPWKEQKRPSGLFQRLFGGTP